MFSLTLLTATPALFATFQRAGRLGMNINKQMFRECRRVIWTLSTCGLTDAGVEPQRNERFRKSLRMS